LHLSYAEKCVRLVYSVWRVRLTVTFSSSRYDRQRVKYDYQMEVC